MESAGFFEPTRKSYYLKTSAYMEHKKNFNFSEIKHERRISCSILVGAIKPDTTTYTGGLMNFGEADEMRRTKMWSRSLAKLI